MRAATDASQDWKAAVYVHVQMCVHMCGCADVCMVACVCVCMCIQYVRAYMCMRECENAHSIYYEQALIYDTIIDYFTFMGKPQLPNYLCTVQF